MCTEQQKEWVEAQKITMSVDLVEAAKKHLKFLAVVDRNPHLYEDHALRWAIFRYYAFWLPLLAKHLENPVSEDPLVIPLDCEWIWHCHRLNPVFLLHLPIDPRMYFWFLFYTLKDCDLWHAGEIDCEKLYGRILGNCKTISSVQATSKDMTKELWNKLYPEEPYELDINRSFSGIVLQRGLQNENFSVYV